MKKNELYKIFDAIWLGFTHDLNAKLDELADAVLAEDSLSALNAENLALRRKLNHFKREYGRASATIGQLRAELAKARQYKQINWSAELLPGEWGNTA